ncbi:MAG: DUF3102 domain-containing protein [Desulfosporosinus sp.]|nr:DUF3102 domain-containing protein [Desulfosporosinus sp.]
MGRRLKEAKDLLPYGEWGKWLKESVSYSQRTADRLMQVCEEYGTKLLASPDNNSLSDSSPVTNLTYTQALILLGIPEEEREEFIAEHDIESMTRVELQQAVKDRDQAIQEKKDLQHDLILKSSELAQLTTQTQSLEQQVKDYKSKYSAEQEKVTLKQREPEAVKEEVPSARKIAELEKEIIQNFGQWFWHGIIEPIPHNRAVFFVSKGIIYVLREVNDKIINILSIFNCIKRKFVFYLEDIV